MSIPLLVDFLCCLDNLCISLREKIILSCPPDLSSISSASLSTRVLHMLKLEGLYGLLHLSIMLHAVDEKFPLCFGKHSICSCIELNSLLYPAYLFRSLSNNLQVSRPLLLAKYHGKWLPKPQVTC